MRAPEDYRKISKHHNSLSQDDVMLQCLTFSKRDTMFWIRTLEESKIFCTIFSKLCDKLKRIKLFEENRKRWEKFDLFCNFIFFLLKNHSCTRIRIIIDFFIFRGFLSRLIYAKFWRDGLGLRGFFGISQEIFLKIGVHIAPAGT